MQLVKCLLYIALMGVCSFLLGRLLSQSLKPEGWALFRCFAVEDGGKLYDKLRIHDWQNKVPDMSKLFPGLIPKKAMTGTSLERLELMIHETCIAELVHGLLCVGGFGCLYFWPGPGGVVMSLLNILGNLPFMLIQRYNRPRLVGLYDRQVKRAKRAKGVTP